MYSRFLILIFRKFLITLDSYEWYLLTVYFFYFCFACLNTPLDRKKP